MDLREAEIGDRISHEKCRPPIIEVGNAARAAIIAPALRVLRAKACGAKGSSLGRSIEAEDEVRIGPV